MFEFFKKKEEKPLVNNVISMDEKKRLHEEKINEQISDMVRAAAFIMAEEKFPNSEITGGGGRGITRTGLVSAEAKKLEKGLKIFVDTREQSVKEALLAHKASVRGDMLVRYYNTLAEGLDKEEQAA